MYTWVSDFCVFIFTACCAGCVVPCCHVDVFTLLIYILSIICDSVKDLQGNAIALLGRFISIREANFRYLGLETMARLAHIPGSLAAIKKHQVRDDNVEYTYLCFSIENHVMYVCC